MTPGELANLAHLRRARDLMDREYARPLHVTALARTALMSTAHFSRQFRAARGESGTLTANPLVATSPGMRATLDRYQEPKPTCGCQYEQHSCE